MGLGDWTCQTSRVGVPPPFDVLRWPPHAQVVDGGLDPARVVVQWSDVPGSLPSGPEVGRVWNVSIRDAARPRGFEDDCMWVWVFGDFV